MAWEFEYDQPTDQILEECKNLLENTGYEIEVYAPESNIVVSEVSEIKYLLRRYDYQVIIMVSDRIQVFLSATKFVYKRGSELSLFGKQMVDYDVEDRLPLKAQEKIMQPLNVELQRLGYIQSHLRDA